jgi:excisionase family DNA binding protein
MLHELERPFKPKDGDDGRFAFPPAWLSYPAAVHYCGLSRTTLSRLVEAGEIDAARYGRAVRISRDSLESFMRSKVSA